jgi:hypothetical protein
MKPIKGKNRAALLALALAAVSSFSRAEMIPKGWVKAGTVPQMYDVSLLRSTDGRSAVTLSSIGEKAVVLPDPMPHDVFGTLMQTISSAAYAGKRLRLTATVSADMVRGWAGLWMRVDGAQGKALAFDNMMKHPIKGSAEAKKYSVVLDVPANAQSVSYGILLDGPGAVTLSGVSVETVGKDVPITSGPIPEPMLTKPQNLDFSEN